MNTDVEDFILILCSMVGAAILQRVQKPPLEPVMTDTGSRMLTGPPAEPFQKSIRWGYFTFHMALLTIFVVAALIDLNRYLSTILSIYLLVFALSLVLAAFALGAGFVAFKSPYCSSRLIAFGAMLVLPVFEVYAVLGVLYILLELLHHTLALS
ncbi:MAG: hypothetical protein BWY09_00288 [Candidatus Hydrogenedentes bacterium ADurb.Bin179]|nr:MAG: hypothetical protein BWY09_00288 [Candidatus Hydrogenedentes bacterium ADurb.Bin179]